VALQLRNVRTPRYSCTFELGSGSGELYDLLADPQQMDNRFEDPAYAEVRDQLHALMLARPGKILDVLAEPVGIA
jgi:hypothetical protein